MSETENILQELKELNSSLGRAESPGYQVPAGYFGALPAMILKRIQAMEAADAREELGVLSPLLDSISRKTPYSVPEGYFQTLSGLPFQETGKSGEMNSSMLAGLNTKTTYTVPAGYFDNLAETMLEKARSGDIKIIPITSRKWFRYAAAAAIVVCVALIGLVFQNRDSVDPDTKSYAWVEKNMKKVSTDEIAAFVELVGPESNDIAKTDANVEIGNLLQDVSDKEIQDFLNETLIMEPSGDDDLIWN